MDKDELYDLDADVGATTNLFERHPRVVSELRDRADACRDDLGDARTGIAGANCRPAGRVENPRTPHPAPGSGRRYLGARRLRLIRRLFRYRKLRLLQSSGPATASSGWARLRATCPSWARSVLWVRS